MANSSSPIAIMIGIIFFNCIYTYGVLIIHDRFMQTKLSDTKALVSKVFFSILFAGVIMWLNTSTFINEYNFPSPYFLGIYATLGIIINGILMFYDYLLKDNDEIFRKWDSYFSRLLVTISIIAIPGATSSILRAIP